MAKERKDRRTLEETLKGILKLAEEAGVEENDLFRSVLHRYIVQLDILDQLEEAMKESGMLVSKEYVRGRKNLYTNPAVAEYNRTTDSANKTASTLLKIIKSFSPEEKAEEEDPLMLALQGNTGDDVSE